MLTRPLTYLVQRKLHALNEVKGDGVFEAAIWNVSFELCEGVKDGCVGGRT